MAASRKIAEQEPGEIELLLPWHAAGTLDARDSRKVEEALAHDPELARQYAVIREEYAGTIDLNESLGAPSMRPMLKLFAAIDAEPARKPGLSLNIAARLAGFFSSLSPRTLAWSAGLGALALVLQAGIIGTVLMNNRSASFQTASLSMNEPVAAAAPRALVRFVPDARMVDVTALLDKYQASIVGGASGGMFRLQFANAAMSKDEFSSLLGRLQNEKIVGLAVATP
jgi:anti-sigma factor RsiW